MVGPPGPLLPPPGASYRPMCPRKGSLSGTSPRVLDQGPRRGATDLRGGFIPARHVRRAAATRRTPRRGCFHPRSARAPLRRRGAGMTSGGAAALGSAPGGWDPFPRRRCAGGGAGQGRHSSVRAARPASAPARVFKWATESAILMAMVSQQGAGFRLSRSSLGGRPAHRRLTTL